MINIHDWYNGLPKKGYDNKAKAPENKNSMVQWKGEIKSILEGLDR